ncbi:MAG: hypothetical protein PHS82_03075 [Lachnospiraceae bacterium]|nr:hypothetical protein [Lachnospiraceae bacterium]
MSFSRNAANQIFNSLFGNAQYATLASTSFIAIGRYIDGSFVEYGRALVGNYQSADSKLVDVGDGTARNKSVIYFPESQQEWGNVTHFAVFNSATSLEPLFVGALTASVQITSGCVPIFRTEQLQISFSD